MKRVANYTLKHAAIKGIGVVGGFGSTTDELLTALQGGQKPQIQEFDKPGGGTLKAFKANTSGLSAFMERRALRRIDHFSRMALYGAHLALADGGIEKLDPERTALVIASGYGAVGSTFTFLDSMIDGSDQLSSPTHFSNSVHNAAAAHISMTLGIKGPNHTITQFGLSVGSALLSALSLFEDEGLDRVLFGSVEEFSPVYGYAGAYAGGYAGDYSSDTAERETVCGEGAAFLLLEREAEGFPTLSYSFEAVEGEPPPDSINALGEFPTRQAFDLAIAARLVGEARPKMVVGHVDGNGGPTMIVEMA